MSDIRVLIVVDGIFSLTTSYPINPNNPPFGPEAIPAFGPDAWFTISHLINTLRNSPSPTFTVDTASRGFNAAGNFPNGLTNPTYVNAITNTVPDPDATIKGPDPSNPTPFHFDDPGLDLSVYDEIWLFSDEGYDGTPIGPVGPPGPVEPGGLTDSELTAITNFMQAGGGVFAVGDHDGLGSAVGGRIPRVRFMRKWYSPDDPGPGIPVLTTLNWPGGGPTRVDTLQQGATDPAVTAAGGTFFFDDQSDDIPQKLTVLVPSHPVIQGATGVLTNYPDHMHEGEVLAPSGSRLAQTFASDPTLSFTEPGFIEFPAIALYQELPVILARSQTGTLGPGDTLVGHGTIVPPGAPEDKPCENANFDDDASTCDVKTNDTLAAYDGSRVNVGRIVTDSSFHHFLDLNLLGDPCSIVATKQQGFNASASGKAILNDLSAFYINLATWLAWKRNFYFVAGKNEYGRDEVNDTPGYSGAFYLFLEGFTPNVVGPSPKPTLSGTFDVTHIPGLSISGPVVTYDVGNMGASANITQRIRFEYSVTFTTASLAAFPASGSTAPNAFTLDATVNIQGKPYSSLPMEFFLLGGEDPYFTNINDTARNLPYLSQDLRVFTITPTGNNQTFAGEKFTFTGGGNATTLDVAAGYNYIQGLITSLNKKYGYLNSGYLPPDTNVSDPLNGLLPQQNGALNGDSMVTPKTGANINYNFAIARVRLKGSGASASGVKVFFRVFTTQTFDTDYINVPGAATGADPDVTYPSSGSSDNPQSPQPGTAGPSSGGAINGCSLPFFATANYDDNPSDYAAVGGANNQNINMPGTHEYAWAFYGCFLNVNDATNQYGGEPVQHWFAGAAHSCLVAQIAYEYAPIENANGVIENPAISDKLAQRNLQVTTSGNPGFPATHRVPQTFDVRPSPPPQSQDRFSILSYPDEIMIDWGGTPVGSKVSIYWPGVSAASVLQLAAHYYPTLLLSAVDVNTVQCEVISPVTYIPIPTGAGGSFAGLITVDLPSSVRYGNEFDVHVRRIATKQVVARGAKGLRAGAQTRASSEVDADQFVWRYISGSFLARISVERESKILPVDENLLAILKWRLSLIGPSNRWYPVLKRWISYLYGRILGMGGDPEQIPPSSNGYQPPSIGHGPPVGGPTEHCHTGKVIGIRYDRFGDFEGFTLLSKQGEEHWFRGREHGVEELVRRAWIERTLISVCVDSHDPEWPASIVLKRWK